MRLLLQRKANPHAQNKAGKSAADLAKNDSIRALIQESLSPATDTIEQDAAEASDTAPDKHKDTRKRRADSPNSGPSVQSPLEAKNAAGESEGTRGQKSAKVGLHHLDDARNDEAG